MEELYGIAIQAIHQEEEKAASRKSSK